MDDLAFDLDGPDSSKLDQASLELEQKKLALGVEQLEVAISQQQMDILKTLHAAGAERWKDRRENEWKLNYAIWGALAGLDALLLHDRSGFTVRPLWLMLGSFGCVVLHMAYLYPTITRAISEIKLQGDTEKAMRALIEKGAVRDQIKVENIGGAIDKYANRPWLNTLWQHYGLVAPILFTMALLSLGCVLLRGHGAKQDDPSEIKITLQHHKSS